MLNLDLHLRLRLLEGRQQLDVLRLSRGEGHLRLLLKSFPLILHLLFCCLHPPYLLRQSFFRGLQHLNPLLHGQLVRLHVEVLLLKTFVLLLQSNIFLRQIVDSFLETVCQRGVLSVKVSDGLLEMLKLAADIDVRDTSLFLAQQLYVFNESLIEVPATRETFINQGLSYSRREPTHPGDVTADSSRNVVQVTIKPITESPSVRLSLSH